MEKPKKKARRHEDDDSDTVVGGVAGALSGGVAGALLGTTASLVIMISYDPTLVYRHVFHKRSGVYYRTYFLQLLLVMATGALVYGLCLPFGAYTVGSFLGRGAVCVLVPNGLWYLLFRRDPRFGYLRETAMGVAGRLLRRNKQD